MKSISTAGNAVRTVFPTPATPLTKFAKVSGVLTALASQTEISITFASAPADLAPVEIFFGADIVIPPATRTVSGVGATLTPPTVDKGLTLFLNVSAASGTAPTLDCKVQQLDLISGGWFDVPGAAFTQAVGVSATLLSIFAGAAGVANSSVNRTIRNQYRVAYTIGGTAPSFTFSVGDQATF